MDRLQKSRDKSTFYFWTLTASTCFQPPASPTQTVTGLMSGRSGFLEAVLQVNKFWAICFHTAPFHYQVPPPPPLPTLFLDIYLINFPLCLSLCPHPKWGKRGLEKSETGRENGKFVQPDVLRQSKQCGNLVSCSAALCDLAMMLLISMWVRRVLSHAIKRQGTECHHSAFALQRNTNWRSGNLMKNLQTNNKHTMTCVWRRTKWGEQCTHHNIQNMIINTVGVAVKIL